MTLDVLDDLDLGQCRSCERITWRADEQGRRCDAELGDGTRCRGLIEFPFHEDGGLGWHRWPHRNLADGRLLALEPLLTGFRLHVVASPWNMGSDEVYDFPVDDRDTEAKARAAYVALHRWDGTGEPEGWYRHRPSNRRRPGGDPEQEYVMR